jgi:excisionase family DNA binding protein
VVEKDILLTSAEVIAILQVNRRTLYRLIQGRAFPARRVGRHWRFRKNEILRWLRRHEEERPPADAPTPRVLVVDDDESVRAWMKGVLVSHALEVDAVADGRDGLNRLLANRYELVIVDLRMPELDGLSMIRQVRGRASDVPIIVVTGYSTEASAVEALNLGVSGYLTKPFRLPQLMSAVNQALRR